MRAVSFGARFSISLSSGIRMTASVCWAEIYKSFVGSPTEAKLNRMFSLRQRTDERHTAVSLIQFSYNLVFSTLRDRKRMNSVHFPRQTPPREHSNATTKAYA